jgi:hypothetical protein
MDEHVDITPQITDPDMMRRPAASAPKAETAGIFTSLYDNKIIALCIVVAIIVIAICAYVFFRRDTGPLTVHSPSAAAETPPPGTTTSNATNVNTGTPAQTVSTGSTLSTGTSATPTITNTVTPTSASGSTTAPSAPATKEDLQSARDKLNKLLAPPDAANSDNDFDDVLENQPQAKE